MNISELLASLGLSGSVSDDRQRQFMSSKDEYSPAMQNLYRSQDAMPEQPQQQEPGLLSDIMERIKFDLMYNQFADQYTDGSSFASRLGYTQPTGKDSDFTVGVSGSGYNINTPSGVMKDYGVTGGDVGYRFGPNRLSADYERYGAVGNDLGQVPVKDLVRLLYQRQF